MEAADWTEALNAREGASLRIHLIGVAGSGMSGLAGLLLRLGHRVSGSDRVSTEETERLEGVGLVFSCPHSPEALADAELVIVSSAIRAGNVALDEANRLGLPILLRAEALAAFVNGRRGILVAGTHGKTTTSALAAHVLRAGGLRPSHYVGAEIPLLGTNAHWSEGSEWFVAEGDESDGTLVNYRPEYSLLLNIEEEHLDHYRDLDEIRAVFARLAAQTRGSLIYCGSDPEARKLGESHERGLSYGWEEGLDFVAYDLEESGHGIVFTVDDRGQPLGRFRLGIPGRHNVLNALAVIALARELGLSFEAVGEALEGFRGARRRFETKYESSHYRIIDDYGHHPTEILATLKTAEAQRARRILTVFQPHRYSRTQLLRDAFATAFEGADHLYVTDVYPASEAPIPGVDGQMIAEAVRGSGTVREVVSHPDKRSVLYPVGNALRPGDLVLTLGAGDIHEVGTRLARDLETLEAIDEAMDDPDAVLRLYEPMSRHTTIRVGGPAQFWVEPSTVKAFAALVRYCHVQDLPLQVVGRGSNLLVRDGGIPGVVAHPVRGELGEVGVEGDRIVAGVGVRLKRMVGLAQSSGLGGFEWMEGIPGNVGGSVRMNAGAMGGEMIDQLESVAYLDAEGNLHEKRASEIEAHYRSVPEFTRNYVVRAVFRGVATAPEEIAAKVEASQSKRRHSQPAAASAGCIFQNPPGDSAGRLVDELGLKGHAVGPARVSDVHGNFIVNDGKASAREVLGLIREIQARAREDRGVALETEVQILGQDDPI